MQARSITYELCTSTIDAVQLAQNYQLHGIELCNVLSIGGISPSLSFLKQSRDIFKGEISVLIRPSKSFPFTGSKNFKYPRICSNRCLCKNI